MHAGEGAERRQHAHTLAEPEARQAQPVVGTAGDASFALAGLLAAAVFVAVNHALLAIMLLLGRGHTFRESGLFSASGLGIELMCASDNVLRGGLTPKHIDVPELLSVLDFTPAEVPYLHSTSPSEGVAAFTPDDADFELLRIDGMFLDTSVVLTGPAIALCTSGEVSISGAALAASVVLGDSLYITPDEVGLRFTGSGTVFVATTRA